MNELIAQIKSQKRNPTKDELWDFVNSSLQQISTINDEYTKLFEDSADKKSIVKDIEEKYAQIISEYTKLFVPADTQPSKVQELQSKIEEIQNYHKELITSDDSIKSDIDESQKHITDFYNYLFGDAEDQGWEDKTKSAINIITNFQRKLTEGDTSIQSIIETHRKKIEEEYNSLFTAASDGVSKIDKLNANISSIDKFKQSIEKETKPKIETTKKELEAIQKDLETKRNEVASLLSDASVKTLLQSYSEAMSLYTTPKEQKYVKNKFRNVLVFLNNRIFRHVGNTINYLLFIVPLIIVVIIMLFVRNDGDVSLEFSIYKFSVSLPLLWIAWFAQRNISQRKRLFEEYNHKLRAIQMYHMFTSEETSFVFGKKAELEDAVLQVISSNPAKHLGRGETMIDGYFDKKGYQRLVEDIVERIKDEIPSIFTTKSK